MIGQKVASLTFFSRIISFLLTTRVVTSADSSSCSDVCAPFIPGAVAYWPMTNETKGSDLSGNDNHATFVGLTYTKGPTDEDNQAVHFNGSSNSYASVNHSPTLEIGKYPGFSFSGYVKFSRSKSAALIDWSDKDSDKYNLFIVTITNQKILLKLHPVYNNTPNHIAEFKNHKLINGAWHFIGISYDKATGNATMFKDGNIEVKQLDKDVEAGTLTSKVGLGIDLSNPEEFNYNGDMSCMMLFKYAMTTSDDFRRVREFCKNISKETVIPPIAVSNKTTTNATASWTESSGIFSKYKITIERNQSGLDQESVDPQFIPASVTLPRSVVLTNLVPGATYRVHVWHMERELVGRARSSAWFDTELAPVESEAFKAFNITATSAEVKWKTGKGYFESYLVDVSPTMGGATVDPSIVPNGMTTTSLKNLTPSSFYNITIRTKIRLRMSSPSMTQFETRKYPDSAKLPVAITVPILVAVVVCGLIIYFVRRQGRQHDNEDVRIRLNTMDENGDT